MNLSHLSDHELDLSAVKFAGNERIALHIVLEHIAEVLRRKSFSPKYKNIKHYVMGHMGYEERSASRRVSATFLMMEIPEIKESIQNGKLDLTKVESVQNFVRAENFAAKSEPELSLFDETPRHKMTTDEKRDVLQSVIEATSRETNRILASKSSHPEKFKTPDQIKAVDHNLNKIQATLTDKDLETLQELRGLLAHKIPDGNLSAVLSESLTLARDAIKKEKSGSARKAPVDETQVKKSGGAAGFPEAPKPTDKRQPTASMKRAVYTRAGGKCELCGSTHATEDDHIIAWAHGGETTFENLRLLCRNCNQREAYKKFGPKPKRPVANASHHDGQTLI